MNYPRALIGGVVGGIVIWLVDFVMHAVVLGPTYLRYPVFTQEESSPLAFLVVELAMAVTAALFFGRTRASWGEGAIGGATFGFYLGLVRFFMHFFDPLVFEGFPYYLGWCWGGIYMIDSVILGVILALLYKK